MHNSGLHLFSADLVTTHGDWSCTWRPSWENNEFCDELRSLRRRQRSRKLWPRLRGGTRRRLMQRILSLFVLHNPPRELEQEAGIEVSCRWFRSSGRCTTNNTFVRFGTLLDRTYPLSSGSLKSRLKKLDLPRLTVNLPSLQMFNSFSPFHTAASERPPVT